MSEPRNSVLKDPETGDPLGIQFPASEKSVAAVLFAAPVGDDGRSEWTWLRLVNGDLMLGVFPQGRTYEKVESLVNSDFDREFRSDERKCQ